MINRPVYLVLTLILSISLVKLNNCKILTRLGNTDDLSILIYTNGSYSISVKNIPWLNSSDTFVQANGRLFTNTDDSLVSKGVYASAGRDQLGDWDSIDFIYNLNPKFGDNLTIMNFSIISYRDLPLVRFRQIFLNGANRTITSTNSVSSSFPSFAVQTIPGETLGYFSFGGMMCGDMEKIGGRWNSMTSWLNDGMQGGPLILFNGMGPTLVLSSMSNFMSSSMQHVRLPFNSIHFGLMGGVDSIPPEYTLDFAVYYSDSGINSAMKGWGDSLLKFYGKSDNFRLNDLTNNYLGYWTDNGAYYYWLTETGKTYQDTMLDVVADFQTIPYQYLQYDSWWYGGPLGLRGGCVKWESPTDIFPDGPEYLFNKTNLPVSAHNKYWDEKVLYARQNGGQYNFLIDPFTQKSLPDDDQFWSDLFNNSTKWGLVTYEQDWLNHQTLDFTPLLTDPNLGRRWLLQMGLNAGKHNITVQYCMSLSRHVLQSVEIPAVTQVRVTNDYATNWQYGGEQWRIGVSSLLAYAVGLAPFKDVFWSTEDQPGNRYGLHAKEYFAELESAISTLSSGPVGPGDKIGLMNESIIMRCCAMDGLILKPSKPITAIDNQLYAEAFSEKHSPYGEVWTTYSQIGNWTFGIVLAVDLKETLKFSCTSLNCGFQTIDKMAYWKDGSQNVSNFDEEGFELTKECTKKEFCLYHIGPIFQVGSTQVVFRGESAKWVPLSSNRVQSISITSQSLIIYVQGAPQESSVFEFYSNGATLSVTCYFNSSLIMKITWTSSNQISCS